MGLHAASPLLADAPPPAPSAETCSPAGPRHVDGGAPATPDKRVHASHCNLCPFGAERGAAISASAGPLPLPLPAAARRPAATSPPAAPGAPGILPLSDGAAPQLALSPPAPPRAPPIPS